MSQARISFPARYNAADDLLSRNLEVRAAKVAYVDDATSLTYGALSERANRAGNALLALGVEPEQRVLLVMHDTVGLSLRVPRRDEGSGWCRCRSTRCSPPTTSRTCSRTAAPGRWW